MTKLNSDFSVRIADYIKAGKSVSDAIHIVIGGITDGTAPRTTAILEDLQALGAFNPKPIRRTRKAA